MMRWGTFILSIAALTACDTTAEQHDAKRSALVAETPEFEACENVERIAGPNRFATAVALANTFRPNTTRYVIVGADAGIDAASASPLADRMGAAILPSSANSLSPEVSAAISAGDTVTLLGGTAVLSNSLVSELQGMGASVDRIAGPDRFSTAAEVASRFGISDLAIIASGENASLADAVVAGALGAHRDAPVLLVRANEIPQATATALSQLGVDQTIVIGGTAAVSNSVVAALPGATRIAGADRVETAALVAMEGFVDDSEVFIVEQSPSPDAFWAAGYARPLLYAPSNVLPAPSAQLAQQADRAIVVGGVSALSLVVETAACAPDLGGSTSFGGGETSGGPETSDGDTGDETAGDSAGETGDPQPPNPLPPTNDDDAGSTTDSTPEDDDVVDPSGSASSGAETAGLDPMAGSSAGEGGCRSGGAPGLSALLLLPLLFGRRRR